MTWQDALVALIVAAAGSYAAWQLMPASLQHRLGRGLGALAHRAGWARAGQRIEHALQPSGGCHGCDAKGSCASSTAQPVAQPGQEQPLRFTRRG